jgi:hypothetical protein
MELKHIAPYLPYRVEVYQPSAEGRKTFTLNCERLRIMEVQGFDLFKLVLRPLSDLDKEINYLGEQVVLAELYPQYFNKPLSGYKLGYELWQMLFSLHFDVFDLIYKGYAIDINSLKSAEPIA